jgi:hypothetical protein
MQFFEQYYGARIILWMVVFITSSGVVLAGLQLALSYRLTLLGHDVSGKSSEMRIERSRIVLTSSTIGIFILIVSCAFFFIFVTRMYPAKAISLDDRAGPQASAARPSNDAASSLKPVTGGANDAKPSPPPH